LTTHEIPQNLPRVLLALTESALRWLRFNGDVNGFNRCVLAVGRTLLIDVDAFERWLDAHRDGEAAA